MLITYGIFTAIIIVVIGVITEVLWEKDGFGAFCFGFLLGGGFTTAFSAVASYSSNNAMTGGIVGATSAIGLILLFIVGTTIPWMVWTVTEYIEAHRERELTFMSGPCPCGCTDGEFCAVKESNSSIL